MTTLSPKSLSKLGHGPRTIRSSREEQTSAQASVPIGQLQALTRQPFPHPPRHISSRNLLILEDHWLLSSVAQRSHFMYEVSIS